MMGHALVDELEIEKSHSDHMAGMAQYWMRRAQGAEQAAGVLILAAGGEIVVHLNDLEKARSVIVERWEEQRDMTTHFRAKVVQPNPDREV